MKVIKKKLNLLKNNFLILFKLLIISILKVNFNRIILDTKTVNKYDKLVKIYYYVCEKFEEDLQYRCERFCNNKKPKLTDQEILTIYLFVMEHQGNVDHASDL